jgi:hypothetical protein
MKCKENQAKSLAFPFISLAESGLFKGLRAKKQKNLAGVQLAFEVASRRPQTLYAHLLFPSPWVRPA